MLKVMHPVAGAMALLTILTFWLSTLFAKRFGSESFVVSVKTSIPWGFFVLIPAALFLASKARVGEFDTAYYTVQALEVLAGATNITLLALNMRDGLRLKGRLRRAPA